MNFVVTGSRLFYKNCIYRVILRYTLLHRNKYKAYTAIKLPRGKAGLAPQMCLVKTFFSKLYALTGLSILCGFKKTLPHRIADNFYSCSAVECFQKSCKLL